MIRRGSRIGKYRVERRIGDGGFAAVYRAYDTIEGRRVAIKIPTLAAKDTAEWREQLEAYKDEVRVSTRLSHPNVLPIKDASILDEHLVIVYPLGEGSLADRIRRRLSYATALDYAGQMLAGLAHAHERRVLHRDIKPENMILFADGRLRISDFGLARFAHRSLRGSNSGTLGYMAPEQAMGRPSLRSDVFSIGLVLYRLFAGVLPEWPYEWPPPNHDRLRRKVSRAFLDMLERSLQLDPRKRFASAVVMQNQFERIASTALEPGRSRRARPVRSKSTKSNGDWRVVRQRAFQREFGRVLETRLACRRCSGPVSESMRACPWCGVERSKLGDDTTFPSYCPRCERGMKLDWKFCAWCYGGSFEASDRQYPDRRYAARCDNRRCSRKELMPFMKYCPWCRKKVTRRWKLPGSSARCPSCHWGIAADYWNHCPWCTHELGK